MGYPDDLIVYGRPTPDMDPVPLLDLRPADRSPLPDPENWPCTDLQTGRFGPDMVAAALDSADSTDPCPVVLVTLDAQWHWAAYGIVVTSPKGAEPTFASEAIARLIGRAHRHRARNPKDLTVLYRLLADPDRWVATTQRRDPLPLTRERLTQAVQWSIVGVEHEWQARRWARYGVPTPARLKQWRDIGYTNDAKIEQAAPYVSVPNAARQFPSLPVREMQGWYSAGVWSEDAALRAKERGWRPGQLGHLTHAMYRCLNLHVGPLKDALIDLLDEAGPFDPTHAIVAFRAGLDVPAVIDLINTDRLVEEQDGLRLLSAMR